MSKSTISTFELFEMFPDAASAEAYFTARRWPDGAICPACEEARRSAMTRGKGSHLYNSPRKSAREMRLSRRLT